MDALKLSKGKSPTNASSSNSSSPTVAANTATTGGAIGATAATTTSSVSPSAASATTASTAAAAAVTTQQTSTTAAVAGKPSIGSGITVRFNAGDDTLDDILESFHKNTTSGSGVGGSSSNSPNSVSGGVGGSGVTACLGLGNTEQQQQQVSLSHSPLNKSPQSNSSGGLASSGSGTGADSLSSSPSQYHQHPQPTALFGNDEVTIRNNFLQGGFFNRKSCGGSISLSKQQLSPNHLGSMQQQRGDGGGAHSPSSPIGGGSPYNGSQAGCSSGGISPINQIGVSPKYRRSISFPMKGSSPTYGGPSMDGSGMPGSGNIGGYGGGHNMHNIPTLSIGNGGGGIVGTAGATGGGDAPYLGANFGGHDRVMMGNGAGGSMDMRSLDNTLNDLMRNMNAASGGGGDNVSAAAAMLADRLRNQKQHLSEVDAMGYGGSNDPTAFLNALKLGGSPSRHSHPHSPHSPHSPQTGPGGILGVGGGSSGAGDNQARFSRKVFVGGLPPDIDEDEITTSFRRFGPLVVDWPHKAESKSYFPPKGYAFLLFQDETSVQQLIDSCITDEDKLYLCVSSPTIKDKAVQIRPWRLADADYVLDATMSLDPRKTVFVGGVPRPLKAYELAMIMDRLYGGVCYAGIDTDPELKYPKGAGRVAFSNQQSYIAAISARFVQLQHGDIDKRVEVKPYVLDDQMCDECEGQRCSGKFAPFFCANVTCLQYYCEHCWAVIHSRPGREYHKPLVKEGADRPRAVPFRWC